MRSTRYLILLMLMFCTRAPAHSLEQGTIVKMRMAECVSASHPLLAALSGTEGRSSSELCPEYTLVTDKVVYRIIGKSSGILVPLAEATAFRLQKSELLIRIDDARHETPFVILEMTVRDDWERQQQRLEANQDAEAGGQLVLEPATDGR